MGLVGPQFVDGPWALGFLLLAEVVAATAVVSESALVYLARHRNLMISLAMIAVQAGLSFALILLVRQAGYGSPVIAAAPAAALALALASSSIVKSHLLQRLLGHQVATWRPALIVASLVAVVVGGLFVALPRSLEWVELVFGVPVILAAYGAVIWRLGFGPEDRELFVRRKAPAQA